MGNYLQKRTEPMRIIMQGLDAAGKTSILYRMKLGEVVTTIPTIGFNVESVNIKGMNLNCWDVGGRDKIRPLLRYYYQDTAGGIFVVDSCDEIRFDYAFEELARILLHNEIKPGYVMMILANKQDLPDAISSEEVQRRWHAYYAKVTKDISSRQSTNTMKEEKNHLVFTRPCSVKTGDGLFEAFDEFVQLLRQQEKPKDKDSKDIDVMYHTTIDFSKEKNMNLSMKTLCRDPKRFFKSLLMY